MLGKDRKLSGRACTNSECREPQAFPGKVKRLHNTDREERMVWLSIRQLPSSQCGEEKASQHWECWSKETMAKVPFFVACPNSGNLPLESSLLLLAAQGGKNEVTNQRSACVTQHTMERGGRTAAVPSLPDLSPQAEGPSGSTVVTVTPPPSS